MEKKRVLVVDDEPEIVKAIEIRLKSVGFEVISAFDGAEALSLARSEKPDLIILDVLLPKMDGYKVSRLLKFDERYKHIPIIMLTAKVEDADEVLGKKTGADAYLKKPFDWEKLHQEIVAQLGAAEE